MPKTALTPEAIDAQLAAAEAEAERLRARQAAIAAAEHDTRHAEELRLYREAYGPVSVQHREVRDTAKERLDALAAAETLDLTALLAAFVELKEADAKAGAVNLHSSRLDNVDPLPRLANGAERTRPSQVAQLYARLHWSEYIDDVITRRTAEARTAYLSQLQAASNTAIDTAVNEARAKAAALADGHSLDVVAPESIAELHRAAAQQIDESQFDPDKIRSAGERTVRRIAEDQALSQLVEAGN